MLRTVYRPLYDYSSNIASGALLEALKSLFFSGEACPPEEVHVRNKLPSCKGAALAVDCKPISSSILKHLIVLLHLLPATCTAGKYVPPAEKRYYGFVQ